MCFKRGMFELYPNSCNNDGDYVSINGRLVKIIPCVKNNGIHAAIKKKASVYVLVNKNCVCMCCVCAYYFGVKKNVKIL